VATATGKYTNAQALELAYYSQIPDQVKDFDAKDNYFHRKGEWSKLVVYNWLHSLHGGGLAAILNRRKCLEDVLQGGMGALTSWQKGLLIHALGDSYAHTYNDNGIIGAYGWPNGHGPGSVPGHRTDGGHWPDLIGNRPELYKAYVAQLYTSLGGTGDASAKPIIMRLFAMIDTDFTTDSSAAVDKLRAFAVGVGLDTQFVPSDKYNTDTRIGDTPGPREVREFFIRVAKHCCSKGWASESDIANPYKQADY